MVTLLLFPTRVRYLVTLLDRLGLTASAADTMTALPVLMPFAFADAIIEVSYTVPGILGDAVAWTHTYRTQNLGLGALTVRSASGPIRPTP